MPALDRRQRVSAGSLDFGWFGSWSLASVFLVDGLVVMAVALGLQLRAIVVLGPQRVRG